MARARATKYKIAWGDDQSSTAVLVATHSGLGARVTTVGAATELSLSYTGSSPSERPQYHRQHGGVRRTARGKAVCAATLRLSLLAVIDWNDSAHMTDEASTHSSMLGGRCI